MKFIAQVSNYRNGVTKTQAELRRVRFRTPGRLPLTAAIESGADSLEAVIAESSRARSAERLGRLIDSDVPGSMEKKKQ